MSKFSYIKCIKSTDENYICGWSGKTYAPVWLDKKTGGENEKEYTITREDIEELLGYIIELYSKVSWTNRAIVHETVEMLQDVLNLPFEEFIYKTTY